MLPLVHLLLACSGGKTSGPVEAPTPVPAEPSGPTPPPAEKDPMPDAPQELQTGSRAAPSPAYAPRTTGFSTRFHQALAGDASAATSGVSASFALGMLAEGAPAPAPFEALWDAPLDQVQVDHARALSAYRDTPGVELSVVNGLWTAQGLTVPAPVVERLTGFFDAPCEALPFEADLEGAAATINTWSAANTGGLIPRLFTPAELADARLVLANALAFKGRWALPFDPELTTDAPFQTPSGEVTVPMMTRARMQVPYTEGVGWKAVMLPYEGNGTAMAIVLPAEGRSLTEAMEGLDGETLASLAVAPPMTVDVAIPRFRVASEHDLIANAEALGLETVLLRTEYSGFGESLVVSKAKQKVVVEVSEEGTEAAAVTAITMKRTASRRTLSLRADRPFLFAVWHRETETPLFIGQLVDPR